MGLGKNIPAAFDKNEYIVHFLRFIKGF